MLALKIARVKKELTQEGLSKVSGVSRVTISNIERGKQSILDTPAGTLLKIAKALDTDITTLFFSNNQ
ncbi:helix-turn-helix transcriptional regulator [Clostridium saudiense]|uniref:helix-turn-helix transcriptional regulator n=1 Tax=Clostridium saudiense TaxID=1414720 RepID=UPI0018A8BEDF|nr:helix-turn-helix transcriptional regulator [Clostridium saudiense]